MRTIEQVIYKYSELDDSAKQSAKEWFSQGGYTWIDDGMDSIRAFCNHFDVTIKDYSICPYSPSWIDTDASNNHFRGLTLKQVEKNKTLELTGYCLDCDLVETMYKVMKETGDALLAFNEAIEAGLKGIISEMEYQDSDEYIEEMMDINDYEFDEQGRRV